MSKKLTEKRVIERTCIRSYVDDDKLRCLQEEINGDIDFEIDADLFAMLASPTRLKILYCLLKSDELCVCDFADIMEMTVSAISHQLRKLKDRGLVKNRRDGLTIYYSIKKNKLEPVLQFIKKFNQSIIKEMGQSMC